MDGDLQIANNIIKKLFMYVYLDCYIYTIDDIRNGMNYANHYNVFEYNYDFLKVL